MLKVVNKDEIRNDPHLLEELRKSIFIYPTDTVYGMGCDATNPVLVEKLRRIKQNSDKPFSIVVPDKKVLESHCRLTGAARQWLDKLPGHHTLVFQLKNRFFSEKVDLGSGVIGVRIPDNWFYGVIQKLGVPVVITSANMAGEEFMTCLDDLSPELQKRVDYMVNDGPITGSPTSIVHLDKPEMSIKIRG